MNQQSPLSFRIEPELNKRLEECSNRTGIKKYTLALLALEAAVNAIEQNNFRLVVPIRFEVAEVPAPRMTSKSSSSTKPAEGDRTSDEEKPERKARTI